MPPRLCPCAFPGVTSPPRWPLDAFYRKPIWSWGRSMPLRLASGRGLVQRPRPPPAGAREGRTSPATNWANYPPFCSASSWCRWCSRPTRRPRRRWFVAVTCASCPSPLPEARVLTPRPGPCGPSLPLQMAPAIRTVSAAEAGHVAAGIENDTVRRVPRPCPALRAVRPTTTDADSRSRRPYRASAAPMRRQALPHWASSCYSSATRSCSSSTCPPCALP